MTNSADLHEVVLRWPDTNAQEVVVTGAFDQWSSFTRLHRTSSGFEVAVRVPWGQKIQYKFIVDGRWAVTDCRPTVLDPLGNLNNVYSSPEKPPPVVADTAAAAGNASEPIDLTDSADVEVSEQPIDAKGSNNTSPQAPLAPEPTTAADEDHNISQVVPPLPASEIASKASPDSLLEPTHAAEVIVEVIEDPTSSSSDKAEQAAEDVGQVSIPATDIAPLEQDPLTETTPTIPYNGPLDEVAPMSPTPDTTETPEVPLSTNDTPDVKSPSARVPIFGSDVGKMAPSDSQAGPNGSAASPVSSEEHPTAIVGASLDTDEKQNGSIPTPTPAVEDRSADAVTPEQSTVEVAEDSTESDAPVATPAASPSFEKPAETTVQSSPTQDAGAVSSNPEIPTPAHSRHSTLLPAPTVPVVEPPSPDDKLNGNGATQPTPAKETMHSRSSTTNTEPVTPAKKRFSLSRNSSPTSSPTSTYSGSGRKKRTIIQKIKHVFEHHHSEGEAKEKK